MCGAKLKDAKFFCPGCGGDLRGMVDDQPAKVSTTPTQQVQLAATPAPKPATWERPEKNYASFSNRFFAFFIDGLLLNMIIFFATLYANFLVYFFASTLTVFLYFFFLEAFFKGQTIGKILLKIRTVDESSFQPPDISQALVNNIARGSFLFLIDFVLGIIANSGKPNKRYRILQNFSRTVVVKL